MYLKTIKLIALIIILSVAEANAQSVTSSPYSRYGLGDIYNSGTGHEIAMGGTTAAESKPVCINTTNPACNTNLLSQCFLFDVGGDVKYTDISSASKSEKTCKATFKYLAGGFAAKPWWYFAFFMKPYSSMGYRSYSEESTDFDGQSYIYNNTYKGSGGLNKVAISTAFKFMKMFSVGFSGNVLFGSIERTQNSVMTRYGYTINEKTYPYSSQLYINDKRVMHGVQGDLGFRFEKSWRSSKDSLRDALRISLGAFVNGKTKLNARNEIFMDDYHQYYAYRYSSVTYYTAKSDTISNDTVSTAKVSLPKGFGIGASVEIAEQLTINADYRTQQWSDFALPDDASNTKLRNSQYYGFGMQYVREKYFTSKYYRQIIYRIGAYKEKTYLEINGQGIDNKGITFGLGFPIGWRLLLNANVQIGKRGTTEHNLYEEKYFMLHLNAIVRDTWFVKRKFQ